LTGSPLVKTMGIVVVAGIRLILTRDQT